MRSQPHHRCARAPSSIHRAVTDPHRQSRLHAAKPCWAVLACAGQGAAEWPPCPVAQRRQPVVRSQPHHRCASAPSSIHRAVTDPRRQSRRAGRRRIGVRPGDLPHRQSHSDAVKPCWAVLACAGHGAAEWPPCPVAQRRQPVVRSQPHHRCASAPSSIHRAVTDPRRQSRRAGRRRIGVRPEDLPHRQSHSDAVKACWAVLVGAGHGAAEWPPCPVAQCRQPVVRSQPHHRCARAPSSIHRAVTDPHRQSHSDAVKACWAVLVGAGHGAAEWPRCPVAQCRQPVVRSQPHHRCARAPSSIHRAVTDPHRQSHSDAVKACWAVLVGAGHGAAEWPRCPVAQCRQPVVRSQSHHRCARAPSSIHRAVTDPRRQSRRAGRRRIGVRPGDLPHRQSHSDAVKACWAVLVGAGHGAA